MFRFLVVAFGPLAIAVLLLLGRGPASGDELLADGGFENGLDGWAPLGDGMVGTSGNIHTGSQALQISGPSDGLQAYKDVPIAPGEAYQLSGFLRVADSDVQYAHLRVYWLGSSGFSDSTWVDVISAGWQYVETNLLSAPPDATTARLTVVVALDDNPGDGFTIEADDLSFQGPPAPTTGPATPTPSSSPSPQPTPTSTPTASPSSSATQAPSTPTPYPTVTPTTAPSTPSPTTVHVFPSLTNGGFEEDGADGAPFGWRKIGGSIHTTSSHVWSGQRAIELRSQSTSTKWAYQTVLVDGGSYYEAGAFALLSDTNIQAVFLRVSWYASADGSGEAMSSSDSPLVESPAAAFRQVSTGVVQAPDGARSARVRLMLRPASGAEAVAYFDEVEFEQTEEPAATATSTATQNPTTTATASPTTGAESLTPTPPPPATTTATPTLKATTSPSPIAEPMVFATLTNGGFEEAREDGTPYAWHKTGGSVACDAGIRSEGEMSLALSSDTDSTKWAYQVLSVTGSSFYAFGGSAAAAGGEAEAFLRVSWYASEDGSGEAISSSDSGETSSGGWQVLSTGELQSPASARSAKLRLMLRPASAQSATVHFDGLTFGLVAEPGAVNGPTTKPIPGDGPPTVNQSIASTSNTPSPQALGAAATPLHLANVKPPAFEEIRPASASGDDTRALWLALAFGIPAIGFAAIGAVETWRRLAQR